MNIKELAVKYSLNKIDFWECHGSWILTHDAVTKIATIENIIINKVESIFQSETSCRYLITMSKNDKIIISCGEASKSNCTSNYYGCMAEKRGIDRCVLKLINAYEYGIYSEVEADSFKKL